MRNIRKTTTKGATNAQPMRLSRERRSRSPRRICSADVRGGAPAVETSRAAEDTVNSFGSHRVRLGQLDVDAAHEGVEAVGGVRAVEVDALDGLEEVVL